VLAKRINSLFASIFCLVPFVWKTKESRAKGAS